MEELGAVLCVSVCVSMSSNLCQKLKKLQKKRVKICLIITEEKTFFMILISSLPDEYNNLITVLETLKDDKLTWTYMRD